MVNFFKYIIFAFYSIYVCADENITTTTIPSSTTTLSTTTTSSPPSTMSLTTSSTTSSTTKISSTTTPQLTTYTQSTTSFVLPSPNPNFFCGFDINSINCNQPCQYGLKIQCVGQNTDCYNVPDICNKNEEFKIISNISNKNSSNYIFLFTSALFSLIFNYF